LLSSFSVSVQIRRPMPLRAVAAGGTGCNRAGQYDPNAREFNRNEKWHYFRSFIRIWHCTVTINDYHGAALARSLLKLLWRGTKGLF
jgi:hypothetical protein